MAKQSGGMPKIDEDFMKELISQGVPSKQDNNILLSAKLFFERLKN